jgi:hypothetical protein
MKGKIALVIGAAAGYVLGTRDGRQRYDQIKSKAESLWQDPKVQEAVSQVSKSVSDAGGSNGSVSTSDATGSAKPAASASAPAGGTDG